MLHNGGHCKHHQDEVHCNHKYQEPDALQFEFACNYEHVCAEVVPFCCIPTTVP